MGKPEKPLERPVYVTGLMGTGKSTVGALLAEREGLAFVDLDRRVEQEASQSIASLFKTQGEEGFRRIERQLLEQQLDDPTPRVVALGGGALLGRSLRLRALDTGVLLTLTAPPDELARRLAGASDRPLLSGDPAPRLRALLEQRREGYAECHGTLDTARLSPEQAAVALGELARGADLVVAAGSRSYPVAIRRGGSWLSERLRALGPTSLLLVTDQNVARHHQASFGPWLEGLRWGQTTLPPGEQTKSLQGLGQLWEALQRGEVDRRGLVLGVGGGVVTDLAGLAAGTWLRGVRWVAAPSTLLGMVDAAIGGKTAIDLGQAKNVVGVFHQPSAVSADVSLLATEPQRGFASGLAEVIKSALIGDASLLALLEDQAEALSGRDPALLERVVRAAARVKVGVVSRDEREQGERRHLNLGHTLGHALESEGGFDRWTHGEAVALGMVAALRLGESLGETQRGLTARVVELLRRVGLPHQLDAELVERALPLLRHDKKREGEQVHFVLVREPGQAHVRSVALSDLGRWLSPGQGATGP